mgnify:CR=1 FL=1
MEWYVIKVMNGKEKKSKEAIEFELKNKNLEYLMSNLLIPTNKQVKIKKGKKVIIEKITIPGYIFVECESIKELEANIKHINGISGALPEKLSKKEINRILGENKEKENIDDKLYVDQKIKIIDGPFDTFTGTIKEVDNKKQKLKAVVSIFDRDTNIDLNFSQVIKE